MVAVKRAVFQSIASMYGWISISSRRRLTHLTRALPAFTIHTAVNQAKKAFANTKNPRVKAWGPTLTGLSIVPILPYLFDHPVEKVTDKAFDWVEEQMIARGKTDSKKEL
jgi:mitochondrial fission process protein 1